MNRRYTDPDLEIMLSDRATVASWLRVTLAWMGLPDDLDLGESPPEVFDPSGHEVEAFLQWVEAKLPEHAAYLHLGLTSSDLIETGRALQWQPVFKLLSKLQDGLDYQVRQRLWGSAAYTHGVPAAPMPDRHRSNVWADLLAAPSPPAMWGRLRGPTGSYLYPAVTPDKERQVLDQLGLKPYPDSISQVLPRRVWVEWADYLCALTEGCAEIAQGMRLLVSMQQATIEGGSTSSAMPHKNNPSRLERILATRTQAQGLYMAVRSAGPLWLERDLTHSLVDRCSLGDLAHLALLALDDLQWAVDHVKVRQIRADLRASSYARTVRFQSAGHPRSEARRRATA